MEVVKQWIPYVRAEFCESRHPTTKKVNEAEQLYREILVPEISAFVDRHGQSDWIDVSTERIESRIAEGHGANDRQSIARVVDDVLDSISCLEGYIKSLQSSF